MKNHSTFVVASLLALSTFAVPSFGQQRTTRTRTQPQPQRQPAPTPAPAPKRAPAQPAQSSAVTEAQTALNQVEKKLRGEFEATDEYKNAMTEQKEADGSYEAARKAVIDGLASKPEYKAASDTQAAADEALAAARNSGATAEDIQALANKALDARQAVRKMQTDAADADPAAIEAKKKATAAKEKVTGLKTAFDQQMKANPEWVDAKKALDDARAQQHHG